MLPIADFQKNLRVTGRLARVAGGDDQDLPSFAELLPIRLGLQTCFFFLETAPQRRHR
jgi:hypothetical protein